jgi:hypothetical protein
MRKIYFLLSFAFLASTAMAQIDVTFAVDMSNETVSADGVHVTGDWQAAASDTTIANWTPGGNAMIDAGDGLYTLTVTLPVGGYEFKYVNGNAWGTDESVPLESKTGASDNRFFQVRAGANGIDTVPFAGNAMPGKSVIKVIVDMTEEVVDSAAWIFVSGDLITPKWSSDAVPLFKQSDLNNLYIAVIQVADDDYQYKFVNGVSFEIISGDCTADGNRTVTVSGDMVDGPNCFGACGPCSVPVDITFKVDMNQSCLDYVTDGVNLMGINGNWDPGDPMDDSDGDGVFELTLGLQPGDYGYKFKSGSSWEGIGDNRPLTVVAEETQVLEPVCFGSEDVCPTEFWDPADVEFNCDVNDSTLAGDEFVWLFADFTGWQSGAIKMNDDDGDGFWSTTIEDFCQQNGAYKFAIGTDPPEGDGGVWLEENADFSSIGGCGVDNGDFPDNRIFARTSNDAVLLCYTFNTCDQCLVGIEELESLNRVAIYPNPVVGDINIVFENSGQYNIRLLDVTGKVILSTDVNAAQTVIGSDNLNAGVYFIQITDNDNNTVTKKIVK